MSLVHILFLPDSGPGVGGGHVLRCLSLARALRDLGATCLFAVAEDGARLVERFGDGVFAWSPRDEAAALHADAVVFDHYGLDAKAEQPFTAPGRVLMAIDDLADREHAVDFLLDPGFGRAPDDYAGKVPDGARLLLGPSYALLRPGFAAAREAAAFAPVRARVERVFVGFGLSDVGGIAARAVALIRKAHPQTAIDVALSSSAESLPALEARRATDPRLAIQVDAREVAPLVAAADLCVGAGGVTTWERACLGAPTLAVSVADNQRPLIRALDGAGALIGLDLADPAFEPAFLDALAQLGAPGRRARLRETSRELCDGRGAERAADALLSALAAQG